MSAKGPITDFTDDEKLEFKPIFIKYINKEYGPKEILQALGNDKIKAQRFKKYADIMVPLLRGMQSEQRVDDLSKKRDLLIQQNQSREAEIAASRDQSAAAASMHVGDVRVTQSYKI